MSEDKLWYVKQVDLFNGIKESEIMQIADKMVERKCSKKEILYTPFELTNSVYILKKGEVTLYNSHLGKRLIIDVLKPGSIFGNITFQPEKSTHFAEVTEDAYMCIFPMEDFMRIVAAKPNIMLNLLNIMSDRIRGYEKRMKSGLYDAKEKIIHQLQLIRDKKDNLIGRMIPKTRKITHEKLAQYTGLSRETVTRAITALRKEGLIHIDDQGVIGLQKRG